MLTSDILKDFIRSFPIKIRQRGKDVFQRGDLIEVGQIGRFGIYATVTGSADYKNYYKVAG